MAKATVVKDWQCQECGKRMTAKQAERAMFGPNGCPKCGGADIDLAVPSPAPTRSVWIIPESSWKPVGGTN